MQDLRVLADFMTDFWQLVKSDPKDWKEICGSVDILGEKYGSDDLAKRILYAYLDYRESRDEGTTD